jgi:hypothetical protein
LKVWIVGQKGKEDFKRLTKSQTSLKQKSKQASKQASKNQREMKTAEKTRLGKRRNLMEIKFRNGNFVGKTNS